MDNLEIAKALFGTKPQQPNGGQTTTTYGVAVSDSENGIVRVNLGGDTVSVDDDQTVEIETTFAVFEGDEVIVSLVGADGTGKAPCVIGVVGRGDQQQTEINSVINYVWNDNAGLHVSTQERSVQGANILLDSDSLDIRNGNSNSEADQTVYASFGKEVTVGSRASGTVGDYSQVFGEMCVAGGEYSHAEGCWTKATADFSHAEGKYTEATKDGTHAEGLNSVASGYCSHAEGYYTTASGNYAHAEGYQTTASGQFSHAEGSNSIAFSYYQHVQGESNVEDRVKKYADIIGNGNTDGQGNINRSNAYNMDWNGNAEFQGVVYVGGCTPNGETPYPVMRYNSSLSRAEYFNGSAWVEFAGGGGGGGGIDPTDAILRVIAPAGSTVTITKGLDTRTDNGHANAVDPSLYDYYFIINQSDFDGVNPWTVTATLGGDSASDTVIIDSADEYNVKLSYGTLYSAGDSSGWTSMAWSSASGRTAHAPTITYGPASMDLLQNVNHSGIVYHDPVDLTDFSTLIAKGSFNAHSVADNGLYIFSSLSGTYYNSSYVSKCALSRADATDTQFEIDVSSLTGEYYVAFGLARNSGYNAEFVVTEVYLQ